MTDTYFIDCEFDGHNGPLLSLAMVDNDGYSMHITTNENPKDPWVIANVMPIMHKHNADVVVICDVLQVGDYIREFMGRDTDTEIKIVADSPVDIGRFCKALTTSPKGEWESTDYPRIKFVVENIDCYPTVVEGAIQHNAYWDAMALRELLYY